MTDETAVLAKQVNHELAELEARLAERTANEQAVLGSLEKEKAALVERAVLLATQTLAATKRRRAATAEIDTIKIEASRVKERLRAQVWTLAAVGCLLGCLLTMTVSSEWRIFPLELLALLVGAWVGGRTR